jgi:hypothetical protein
LFDWYSPGKINSNLVWCDMFGLVFLPGSILWTGPPSAPAYNLGRPTALQKFKWINC